MLKLQELDSMLGGVEGFSSPKVNLEQYITTPHLAGYIVQSKFTFAFHFPEEAKHLIY